MIESSLLELMPHTVTWSTSSTLDNYGVPTWASGAHSMAARISAKHHEVRDRHGVTREAAGVVWCASVVTSTFVPTVDDRLTLPDGTTPPVLRVEAFDDETDRHHYKVTLGY